MFWNIVRHEIKHRFFKLSTHVYFAILLALSFLIMIAIGGFFGGGQVTILGMGPNTKVNGPFVLAVLTFFISFLGVVITAAFMGRTIYRDYESGMHPLVFTTPVTKFEYLGGRFAGALLMNLYIFTSIAIGLMLGPLTPGLQASKLGAFRLDAYLHPYLTFVLPNLVFTGALFFSLAALTRKMLPNYIGGILLLMGYNIASVLFSTDIVYDKAASLLDPFGQIALAQVTEYWTVAEQNTQLVPLTGTFLYNRLIWVGVGLVALAVLYWAFDFKHLTSRSSRKSKDEEPHFSLADATPSSIISRLHLPFTTPSFSASSRRHQFLSLTRRSFLEIVRDVYFYAIVAASIIFLIVAATQTGTMYGTAVHPVTYNVLNALGQSFWLFMVILITFYAGELVWRERDLKTSQLHDTLPLPNWISVSAKGTALGLMCAVLMSVVLITGVASQAFRGFYDFEIGLYLKELYGVQLIDYLLLGVLALTVHTVVNHKYLGHFVMVLYFTFAVFRGQLGLEHNLYQYASDIGLTYSDMNGYGHFIYPFTWFKVCWAGVAVALAGLTHLFWVRGEASTLRWRWHEARRRLSTPVLYEIGIGLLLFLAAGGYIYYNTTVLNDFLTSDEQEALAADYEKKYGRYEGRPQPRITAVNLDVDIYPSERDAYVNGYYTLTNKTGVSIDSVHVVLNSTVETDSLRFVPPATKVLDDPEHDYRIYILDTPLPPGDSLRLYFDVGVLNDGFTNGGSQTSVVYNGTFFNTSVLPSIGYQADAELSDNDTREEYGLPPKPRMASIDDSTARMNTYLGNDADWVRFDAVVSTSVDQTALAPGRRVRTWTEGDRRYFHYRTEPPTMNFYSFLSAEYAVTHDEWKGIDIAIYYHPKHDYNVDRMIEAVKKALTYYTEHFGPYQNDYVRIAEFPRYATFAQSFQGTIPYSESIGFIAKVDDKTDIDYPFYVTAHEVAHQWWAHQVVGGNVQGATMLSETFSQYSALMVMEDEYGKNHMRRFLEYELDDYLIGRSQEQRKEMPLMLVENQQYIHYNKGSVVMYALKDYLGEERLNTALSRFVADKKFQNPPYTTTKAFMGYLQEVTPDSLQHFVDDQFRRITLYQNRATEATYTPTEDGRYRVKLMVEAAKLQADSLGTETEVPMNDWVDIGVFGADTDVGASEQKTLYLQKHRIRDGEQTITVTVDEKPAQAGVDPYAKLIDRTIEDNVTDASRAETTS